MGRIKQLLIDQPDTDLEDCDLDWQEHQADLMMEKEMNETPKTDLKMTVGNHGGVINAPMPKAPTSSMTPTSLMIDALQELDKALAEIERARIHLLGHDDGPIMDPPNVPGDGTSVVPAMHDTRNYLQLVSERLRHVASQLKEI